MIEWCFTNLTHLILEIIIVIENHRETGKAFLIPIRINSVFGGLILSFEHHDHEGNLGELAERGGVSSLFRQVYIPTGLYSDRSLFRQVYIPTGRYSDRSLFRQVDILAGRYSDRSIFQQVYIPGLFSDRSIFRRHVVIPTVP